MKKRKCQRHLVWGKGGGGRGRPFEACVSLPPFLPLSLWYTHTATLAISSVWRLHLLLLQHSDLHPPLPCLHLKFNDRSLLCLHRTIVFPPLEKQKLHGRDGEQRETRREFQRLTEEELASNCHGSVSGARYVKACSCMLREWRNAFLLFDDF